MLIQTLGVGEAADPLFPNAAVTVSHDGFRLLIDCGHSVPPVLWRTLPEADAIDAIYFTHHHPDHCFGFVPLLIRLVDDRRRKKLRVIAGPEARTCIDLLLAAGGIDPARLPFELAFEPPAEAGRLGPFAMRTAPTRHAVPNRALSLEAGGSRFCYSGDGRPTAEAEALYAGCDLLFHECYLVDSTPEMLAHCDLPELMGLMARGWPKSVRLYHVRADQRAAMEAEVSGVPGLALAVPGETIALP